MASLRKKSRSPYWFACFTDADGKRTQRSTKQRDRKKAQSIAEQFEKAAKAAGASRLSEAQARRVLSDIYEIVNQEPLTSAVASTFLSRWPERKKATISHRTYQAYTQVARDFIASLGPKAERDISQIKVSDVIRYRDQVCAATSVATANKLLKYLRVGLGTAWKEGYIQDNPAAKVDLLSRKKSDSVLRRPFTVSELQTILKHAGSEWKGIILFGLYTGQRLADICSLTWNNVDLQTSVIRFVTRKTGRRMEIPIAAPLVTYLANQSATDDGSAPLFPNAHPIATREMGDSRLSQQFYDILVAAGMAPSRGKASTGNGRSTRRRVNDVSFHSLRHTATSLLKSAGVTEAIAMDIIGHDSEAISRHYTHIESEAKRTALARLPDVTR